MTMKPLSTASMQAMNDYVEWIFAECLSEDEPWPLGSAWRTATIWSERSHIAAAIIYRAEALSDASYRIIDRGPYADPRLALVADQLGLS